MNIQSPRTLDNPIHPPSLPRSTKTIAARQGLDSQTNLKHVLKATIRNPGKTPRQTIHGLTGTTATRRQTSSRRIIPRRFHSS
jgi:hypothetical protein